MVVIVTVRPTYESWTLPGNAEVVWLYGFSENLDAAVDRYFDFYKIGADRTIETLAQFEHPLFLRMFCQTTNASRKHPVSVEIGASTQYEIFGRYIDALEEVVGDRLGLDPAERSVSVALRAIAEELWLPGMRDLPVDRVKQVVGDKSRPWHTSMTKALEDEGVVLRDVPRYGDGKEERVAISYDLLAGWLIGELLIKQPGEEASRLCTDPRLIAALVSEDDTLRHPLADDVVVALTGLLPRRTGMNLWEATDDPVLRFWGTRGLFLVEGEYIDEAAVTGCASFQASPRPSQSAERPVPAVPYNAFLPLASIECQALRTAPP